MPKKLFWTGLRAALVVGIVAGAAFLVKEANAEDLAVGDSIALGTGQALHVRTVAHEGMGSCWILQHAPGGAFDHVLISAGINDAPGRCIEQIRAKYAGAKVVWVLPAAINAARAHVASVAAAHGDKVVAYRCRGGCSKSNFHPASYPSVAAAVQNAWGLDFGYAKPAIASSSVSQPAAPSVIYTPPVPEFTPAVDPHALPHTEGPVRSIWQKVHDFFLPAKVSAILEEEAHVAGVPVELAKRVAAVESTGQCSADNGIAVGVMQVRPMTARAMGVNGDLHDCRTGARAGVRYLALALKKTHGDWGRAAALYNGGLAARPVITGYSRRVLLAKN